MKTQTKKIERKSHTKRFKELGRRILSFKDYEKVYTKNLKHR